ncbi:MAG: hypothetical protein ABSG51_11835 [Terracidiphilus sp.]|jgi:hypothetical protein
MNLIQSKYLSGALGMAAIALSFALSPVEARAVTCTPSGNYNTVYPTGSIFYITSNPYGDEGSTTNGDCIDVVSTTGANTAAWYTQWKQSESNDDSVYAYPEVVFPGGSDTASGLPVGLSSIASIPSIWNYQLTNSDPDGYDVAYDIWVGSTPTTTTSDEIMIWTNAAFGQSGNTVGTFTNGGITFNVVQTLPAQYSWTNHPVYSFCSTSEVSSVNIDISKFLDYLTSNGYISSSWYLQSVDAGIEIRNGTGSLNTTEYDTYATLGTAIVPEIEVGTGAWQATNAVTATHGTKISLGPQPTSGGSWSWTGPSGFTSTARQISVTPTSAGTYNYTATYTNTSNVKTQETFTITAD